MAHWSSVKYTVFCLSRVGKTTGFLTGCGIAGALNKFDLTHILQLFISTWRACPNCVVLLMKENHNLKGQHLSQQCFQQALLFQQTPQFLSCRKWSALFWAWTPPAVLSCFWLHARWGKNCILGSVHCVCFNHFCFGLGNKDFFFQNYVYAVMPNYGGWHFFSEVTGSSVCIRLHTVK